MLKKNKVQVFFKKLLSSQNRPWLITLILLIALYLRIEPALFNITHFSYDQGLDIALVKNLVIDHDLSLISRYTGLQGVLMGPWYTWFMAPAFFISGGSPNADVIYLSLWALAAAIASYFMFKQLVPKETSLLISFFILFSPEFITSSRIVLSPAPLTYLGIIYLWLTLMIIIKKRYSWLPLLALVASFGFQFEIGYAIFASPAVVITLFLFEKFRFLSPKNIFLSIIAVVFPFIPQIVFDWRNDHIISNAIKGFFTGANTSLGSEEASLTERLIIRSETLFSDFIGSISFVPTHTSFVVLCLLVCGYGLYLMYNSKDRQSWKIFLITLSLILSTYIGFIFYHGPVWVWYRAGIPILFVTIFSLSLGELWQQKNQRLLVALVLIVLSYTSIRPYSRWQVLADDYDGDVATLRNQQIAIDSIYADANGEDFALYVYTPPVYPYIWDYQLFWYAQDKYEYLPQPYDVMPQPDNPELVYLLIEPDDIPPRIEGWLGNFKVHGRQLETWKTRGEIVILKWAFETQPEESRPLIRYTNALEK